ncbi:hypothetical protein CKO_01993 [Citrobacter koseri ATCC BAA-895]|uniref:Uncharacterized protein n=1 Tax=Citrobacter koseri (strain ATCC BAA-895 / CDC 4225-83 / SGSC4696) TaxID=290338 RepID=A8AI06_CITK8|nr:hypothetical protein CKO_01993 [Citrobacter koseri ATCC BAA-895]
MDRSVGLIRRFYVVIRHNDIAGWRRKRLYPACGRPCKGFAPGSGIQH